MRNKIMIAIGLVCSFAYGEGIVTPFVDVNMGVIKAGVSTIVKAPGGEGILIYNKENEAVHVELNTLLPSKKDIQKKQWDPLPDAAWVQIEPHEMVLLPHQSVLCRIMVTVPDKKQYQQRNYYAYIWTQMEPQIKSHMTVRGALRSTLRFRVS